MRRLLVISGIILAAVLALLVIRNLSGDSNPYLVRAVFDNGAFVVPDVDVRVAGANVGSVDSICDQLIERREIYGISYVTFAARMVDAVAPIVERLAGT